jgi:23S rRNA (cytosine1962-C5)-methyltransferase
MKIELNLGNNQNIGYFIDMQSCHDWVRQNAKDKQVLNLFSYTCAFSVAALLGGAKHVVNVDMAGGALSTGRYNHYLNQLDKKDRTFMKLDILKSWSRIKKPGPYDLIIIDPPSNQRGSFVAEKDYRKILRRIPQLATPSGQILACLNTPHLSESYLQDVMSQECPDCRFQRRLLLSNDFPEKDNNCSLKILLFRYL